MQVSIRELKANPANAIAQLQGVRVQITSHRKVVAELVMPGTAALAAPVASDVEALQKLLASGMAEPASKPFKLGKADTPATERRQQLRGQSNHLGLDLCCFCLEATHPAVHSQRGQSRLEAPACRVGHVPALGCRRRAAQPCE